MYLVSLHQNHGMFVYPLDDSYIHLTLSRTLAFHHVWGIGPGEFGSASSSPGWTVLLAGLDLVFGSHLLTPLLLNLVCGIGLLFVVDYGIRSLRPQSSLGFRVLAQLAIVFLTSLPNLAYIGMEHVAQTLTILLAVILAVQILAIAPGLPVPRSLSVPLVVAILIAGTLRYEAVFTVLPIAICLLLRRRIALAVLFCACAAVGPLAFGLYSHHLSGFWLPFSVVMKAQMEKQLKEGKLSRFFLPNSNGSFLQMLFIPLLVWILRFRRESFWSPSQLVLLFSFCITALHLALAPTRWLMRYESYFVALAIFSVFASFPRWTSLRQPREAFFASTPQLKAVTTLLVLISVWLSPFLLVRILKGFTGGPKSSVDRYHEHIQMARFIKQFYDHDTVVVNDIGAVSYYSDARLVDLYGLGSAEPARILKVEGHDLTQQDIRDWVASEGASIAILQTEPRWIHQRIPTNWIHVLDWRLQRNLMFGDKTVSLYAVEPSQLSRLCNNLRSFHGDPEVGSISVPGACPPPASADALSRAAVEPSKP